MKLVVNGEDANFEDGLTVSELLVARNVESPELTAVELNGRVLRRSEFDETALSEGDDVNVIFFMGGGSGAGLCSARPRRNPRVRVESGDRPAPSRTHRGCFHLG